ncbi:SDR family oxidoreductase [Paramicrobacterium chengjingii]|uniref:NAD(P)H-binding protein n=1 Tax=Paramicrobacterium chengjingii TaxID=2769067 RepID=A0ABX6YFT1_9MICO|nr:NAD(P)H-binding protein [Microbacterium chengjingii]QPZ37649.1 NAD(P)H-binding protein [Microbacterium chengjingii]
MSSILIVGGTGLVGSAVAVAALARGHAVRSVSREVPTPDAANFVPDVDYRVCNLYHSHQTELDEHLHGIDVVIDCLNGVSHVAQAVFRVGAVQITDAAAHVGVTRIVVVSDVGCDQSDFAYYEAKTDQEGVYLDSAVGTTVVRFTVVFEQMLQIIEKASRFRVMPTSGRAQLQPIDVADVAEVIVDAVSDTGADKITSYGGPEIASVRSLSRQWLAHTGRRALLVPVPLVTAIGRYLRSGANIVPDSRRGSTTWQDWLNKSSPPPAPTAFESNTHPNGTPSPA